MLITTSHYTHSNSVLGMGLEERMSTHPITCTIVPVCYHTPYMTQSYL